MTATLNKLPETDFDRPSRTGTRRKVVGGLLLAVAAIALLGIATRTSDTSTESFGAGISAIDVQSDAGAITFRATDADIVTVTATRNGTFGRAPDTTAEVDGGSLRLTGRCKQVLPVVGRCSTVYAIEVPDGVPVTARSLAGTLEADGLTAGLTAAVSAGQITLRDVAGEVDVATTAGRIEATVRSDRVRATSGAGAVSVTNSIVGTEVVATTEAGAVEVLVPPATYAVDATSTVGRVAVDVSTDPEAPRTIFAHSTAGSVRVAPLSDQ